jgi:TonB family protein
MLIFPVVNLLLAISAAQHSAPSPTPGPSPSPSPAVVELPHHATDKIPSKKTETESKINKTFPTTKGSIEILSDTMGVDFAEYLKWTRTQVQQHWYPLIPLSAMPPEMKSGKVTLTLAVLRDGKIKGLKIEESSGDVALDRAAYGAIVYSSPFAPLPQKFNGEYLMLRIGFLYNPAQDLKQADKPAEQTQKPTADSPKKPVHP